MSDISNFKGKISHLRLLRNIALILALVKTKKKCDFYEQSIHQRQNLKEKTGKK